MTRTNNHIAGGGKAIDAHERNRNRPEDADHLPLKDNDSQPLAEINDSDGDDK